MKHPHAVVVLDDQHRYSALGANGDTVKAPESTVACWITAILIISRIGIAGRGNPYLADSF